MSADPALAAALCAGAGLLGGLLVPQAVARLPEPPPDPDPEPGVDLTAAQRARLAEPPKEPWVDLAAHRWLRPLAVALGVVAGACVGWTVGLEPSLAWWLPLVPVGVLLAVVDARTRLLPSVVVLPATGYAVAAGVAVWLASGRDDDVTTALVRAAVGLVVSRSVFWVLWFVRSAGMGFGDVRLAALLGFVLGWEGWAELAVALYGGLLLLTATGVARALWRRDRSMMRRAIPFGPFLLAGTVVGLAVGAAVLPGLAAG